MKTLSSFVVISCLIINVFSYTDPSTTNPQLVKRFEYKLSFKGPHLSFKDGTVPFWSFGGSQWSCLISVFVFQFSILYCFQVPLLVTNKCV